MYCELFQLNEPPFRLTPDPHFLYASKQHARAKAYMESSIWLADGFVVITGEIGSGKTTLIESFLAELPENVVLAHINQTQLTAVELLQALLVEFGFRPFGKEKVELLSMLKQYMIEQYAEGSTLLLVIDEAQNLSRHVLEELRMISGIEAQKEKLLRIILAGQPELFEQLNSQKLEQLKQRVRLQFHLGTLSKSETREYVEHRLEVAGADGRQIFEDDTFDVIFNYTGGTPRLINTLCDTALLCGFAEEKDVITKDIMMTAIEELQWRPAARRSRQLEAEESEQEQESHAEPAPSTLARYEEHEPEPEPGTMSAPFTPARFDVFFNDSPAFAFDLQLGRTIIGRTPENDLQIASKFVSRHHAQVSTMADACLLEDLNSTNGLYIGSRRVSSHRLADGDVIQLGEHKLVYRDLRSGSSADASMEDRFEGREREPAYDRVVGGVDVD